MLRKLRSSETTGLVPAGVSRTGTPPGATGSGSRPDTWSGIKQDPAYQCIPPSVRQIVPKQIASLLDSLRGLSNPIAKRTILFKSSRNSIDAAIAALTGQLEVAERFKTPASPQKVLDYLTTTAAVFQVSLPEEMGLEIYVGTLSVVPEALLKRAIKTVCETHRFKTMPLIAEILEPIKDDMWAIGWLIETCERRIAELRAMR